MLKRPHPNAPQHPQSPLELIEPYLAAAREAALKLKDALFDLTPATIPVLEQILEDIYQEIHARTLRRRIGLGPSEVAIEQWATVWGIYLGEVLRLELGGTWITGHEEAPTLLAVEFPDGTTTFPTAKVFKRLSDGASESIIEYYALVKREVLGEGDGTGGTAG
jgi:hypothetical protein